MKQYIQFTIQTMNGIDTTEDIDSSDVISRYDYWLTEEERFKKPYKPVFNTADTFIEFYSDVQLSCVRANSIIGTKGKAQPCTFLTKVRDYASQTEKIFKGTGRIGEVFPTIRKLHTYRMIVTTK